MRADDYLVLGSSVSGGSGGSSVRLAGRLRRNGRSFWNDAGYFRPHFASCLSALGPGKDYRPALDEIASLGFNGVRVFGGNLGWAGQQFEAARDRLPQFMADAAARGLYAEVSCLTDTLSRSRSDCERHLSLTADIVLEAGNGILEGGNEIGPAHGTQRSDVADICRSFRAPAGLMYCPGSVHSDEFCEDESLYTDGQRAGYHENGARPYWDEISAFGRDYGTSHTNRSSKAPYPWQMVRHERELEASSGERGIPWFANEDVGSDPIDQPGKRSNNPAVFFALAVYGWILNIGSLFHSTSGLNALPLTPKERECAEASIRGYRLWPAAGPALRYVNVGQGGPVRSAAGLDKTVVRVHSGVSGGEGLTMPLGVTGDPGIDWAWHAELIDAMDGVQVYRVRA